MPLPPKSDNAILAINDRRMIKSLVPFAESMVAFGEAFGVSGLPFRLPLKMSPRLSEFSQLYNLNYGCVLKIVTEIKMLRLHASWNALGWLR